MAAPMSNLGIQELPARSLDQQDFTDKSVDDSIQSEGLHHRAGSLQPVATGQPYAETAGPSVENFIANLPDDAAPTEEVDHMHEQATSNSADEKEFDAKECTQPAPVTAASMQFLTALVLKAWHQEMTESKLQRADDLIDRLVAERDALHGRVNEQEQLLAHLVGCIIAGEAVYRDAAAFRARNEVLLRKINDLGRQLRRLQIANDILRGQIISKNMSQRDIARQRAEAAALARHYQELTAQLTAQLARQRYALEAEEETNMFLRMDLQQEQRRFANLMEEMQSTLQRWRPQ